MKLAEKRSVLLRWSLSCRTNSWSDIKSTLALLDISEPLAATSFSTVTGS